MKARLYNLQQEDLPKYSTALLKRLLRFVHRAGEAISEAGSSICDTSQSDLEEELSDELAEISSGLTRVGVLIAEELGTRNE